MPRIVNPEFRIACRTPSQLEARVPLVGRVALGPPEAGKYALTVENLRQPTAPELARIAAPFDTPDAIRLVRVPHYIGQRAIAMKRAGIEGATPGNPYLDIAEGVSGQFMGITHAEPDTLGTTIGSRTGRPTGPHLDAIDTQYLGINLGPGARYFSFAPYITRENAGLAEVPPGRQQSLLTEYIDTIPPSERICYFVRIPGPDPEYLHGYANASVGRVLHDGSSVGIDQGSDAAFISTAEPIPITTFPSDL